MTRRELVSTLREDGKHIVIVDQLNNTIKDLNLYSSIALVNAVCANDMEAAKAAVADDADVNISHGLPLRHAAECGNIDMIIYLIEQGADANDVLEDIVSCAYDYDRTSNELEKEMLEADKEIYTNIAKVLEVMR